MVTTRKLRGLDLFSGIAGIGLGLNEWIQTIAYCEQDRYAQGVLLSRMRAGDIDRAPIFDDVRNLRGDMFIDRPEIIFAGFPCQDVSAAGLGAGLDGERSGLFFEIIRLTKEIRPQFVFLENVPAIRTRGLDQVIKAFAEIRYAVRWTCLPASSVGADHKRERWFLLAHPEGERVEGLRSEGIQKPQPLACPLLPVRNSDGQWQVEPDLRRVADGVPYWMDRIKCIGNSVVPHQVKEAFEILCGLKIKQQETTQKGEQLEMV